MSDTQTAKTKIVDAMMKLAAERRFEDISIRDIANEAGVSLADFRDAFPSKGAVLAGFSRQVDRATLATPLGELVSSSPRDRLFDVLMRRLDAMAPHRDALRSIFAWLRRDPASLLAMNGLTVNSMRFMLEAAEIENEGPFAALRVQGLALSWARIFSIWLDDKAPDFSKTMAALDRELTRGGRWVAGLERLDSFTAPLRALARKATESRAQEKASEPATDSAA